MSMGWSVTLTRLLQEDQPSLEVRENSGRRGNRVKMTYALKGVKEKRDIYKTHNPNQVK
jgi:hypothetical protein